MSRRTLYTVLTAVAVSALILPLAVEFFPRLVPERILMMLGRKAPQWVELAREMMKFKHLVGQVYISGHEMPSDLNAIIKEMNDYEHRSGREGFKWLAAGKDFRGKKIEFTVRPMGPFGDCEISLRSSGPNTILNDEDDIHTTVYAEVRRRVAAEGR